MIGYDWLINVYSPVSKAWCPGESHLLILDGHVLHTNNEYKFLRHHCVLRTQHTSYGLSMLNYFRSFRPTTARQ